ncbi:MAG: 3-oxoacyl-ACP synthase [Alphaproteobacteria bacterium CG11_big_fil_rev_8_21_14_0_20_44_7]|nr:MAG: 3-oxoacyl-ACP synthase [Alphaproteobacteria bacterium CG11_big_fil_rev_8_21_14_0_20_44_7]
MAKYSKIISCGSYLPEKVINNSDLPAILETSDEWIRARTGITQRHIAADGELTSDLAAKAAKIALEKAGLAAVDLIIVATTTPDTTFPATAVSVQKKLGMHSGFAFDIQAVCSGFVYAMNMADIYIKSGQAKTALVIGAETITRILDWADRGTCVLFGDGAGAVILGESDEPGILSAKLHSDGQFQQELYVDGGVSINQQAGLLRMNGKEVFRHAVEKMGNVVLEALEDADYGIEDVKWLIPHQANQRIMDAIAKRFKIDSDKVLSAVAKHANTSAASIPLAICEHEAKLKSGDLVALTALGAGFTWGSIILKW